ncbi:MAG TPA: FHIPEP family type III secretion protein, partial [Pseudoxanthomonas sp.]|nr:FHIPEP family type III secretion protein [Pseudoxanthomonas sp.]
GEDVARKRRQEVAQEADFYGSMDGASKFVRGDVTVGVGSHVKGGLRVEKPNGGFHLGKQRPPRIVIGPDAVVEGALVFEHPVVLYVHKTAKTGPVSGATAKTFDTPTAPKE